MKILVLLLCFSAFVHGQGGSLLYNFTLGSNISFGPHLSDYQSHEENTITDLQILVPGEIGLPVYFDPNVLAWSMQFWTSYHFIKSFSLGVHYEYHVSTKSVKGFYSSESRIFVSGHGWGPALTFSKVLSRAVTLQVNLFPGISNGTLNRFPLLLVENDRQKQLQGSDYDKIDLALVDRESSLDLKEYYNLISLNFAYTHKYVSIGLGPFYRYGFARSSGNKSKIYPDATNIHEFGFNLTIFTR